MGISQRASGVDDIRNVVIFYTTISLALTVKSNISLTGPRYLKTIQTSLSVQLNFHQLAQNQQIETAIGEKIVNLNSSKMIQLTRRSSVRMNIRQVGLFALL